MRLVVQSGLWTTGPSVGPVPLAAVLEVDGAVLSWTVDEPAGAAIAFTDPARADWLWHVLGESGHRALAAVTSIEASDRPGDVELAGVELLPGSLDRLRRLSLGHWLRRWWPASERDGIASLDRAILDAEIAVLTSEAEEFLGEEALDSDVGELLSPHAAELKMHVAGGDPRVIELVHTCVELAADVGVDGAGWPDLIAALDDVTRLATPPTPARRIDYALAAGSGTGGAVSEPIAVGVTSMAWAGVPPGTFDAAENTIDWTVAASGSEPVALVRAAILGADSPTGIPVRLHAGGLRASGTLNEAGRATLELVDESGCRTTQSAAWDHDWSQTTVTVGVDVEESSQTRERVRRFARQRLTRPAPDAYLAEILAAESDY